MCCFVFSLYLFKLGKAPQIQDLVGTAQFTGCYSYCVRVCVCVCMRACVCACMRACVRACYILCVAMCVVMCMCQHFRMIYSSSMDAI